MERISDQMPQNILVDTRDLDRAKETMTKTDDLEKRINKRTQWWIALAGAMLSCLFGGFALPKTVVWGFIVYIVWGVSAICFFITVILIIINYNAIKRLGEKEKSKDPIDFIKEKAKDNIKYTAVIIICYRDSKKNKLCYMTEQNGNYLIHCQMNKDLGVDQQKDIIIKYLSEEYGVKNIDIKEIKPLKQELFFSIKPIRASDEDEKQNAFIFFHIKMTKKVKNNIVNSKKLSALSIDEMEGDPELMGTNKDIINKLKSYRTEISDSFEDYPIHIVWNITDKCAHNCAICATGDETREELSYTDKVKALNHVLTVKERIDILDFGGGDPMCDDHTLGLVVNAINALGEERVSITTTGEGISKMKDLMKEDDERERLFSKCEITIDASHEHLGDGSQQSKFPRKVPNYNIVNCQQIDKNLENFQQLIINIPLLDDDLTDEEINTLTDKLLKYKNDNQNMQIEAQIIRLMPVGKFCEEYGENEYKNYDPVRLAEKVKTCIEAKGISCRYHCSLRILPELNKGETRGETRCSMLDKKIGIDCSGNVFACTWGAYVQSEDGDIKKNPFFIGNLKDASLKKILEGKSKTEAYTRINRDITNKVEKPYCEAVSWFFEKDMSQNNDPLSKRA